VIEAIFSLALALSQCERYTITAYSVEMFPGTTYDGTPTRGNAGWIAAGSWNLPIGTVVSIDGVGVYTIRDRGNLGSRHIDILTQTTREALNFGRQTRTVCIVE
jgi:3D (Asp-Asp-Asp) domain-containing protein